MQGSALGPVEGDGIEMVGEGWIHSGWRLMRVLLSGFLLALLPVLKGSEPKDLVFTAEYDGSEQRYVELLPTGYDPTKVHDVVLAFHGHGSDRWQFINDLRGECKGVRDAAAKYGMIVVSPDYRARTSWMGPAAEADVVVIAMNAAKEAKRSARNARTKPSATTTPKREHHAKTVATVAMIVLANEVREANVASAEKMRMATTPQRMPKMSAPRAWRQTRLSNA